MSAAALPAPAPDASSRTIRVSEIFGPTIQGEGAEIGRPTVFVRTGGCDYRCAWCDTAHAVLPRFREEWKPMLPDAILARVEELSGGGPVLITLSGGNPALQPCGELIVRGQDRGHTFTMETQGSAARAWFPALDSLTLSPKPPSSGQPFDDAHAAALAQCVGWGPRGATSLKFVVFDERDLDFAQAVAARHPELPVYLSVGNETPNAALADSEELLNRLHWLTAATLQRRWYRARPLPQLHTLLWGNRRGV